MWVPQPHPEMGQEYPIRHIHRRLLGSLGPHAKDPPKGRVSAHFQQRNPTRGLPEHQRKNSQIRPIRAHGAGINPNAESIVETSTQVASHGNGARLDPQFGRPHLPRDIHAEMTGGMMKIAI